MAKRRRKLRSLPPSIQAEGPSQQRIEQQRQAAQSANPNDPVIYDNEEHGEERSEADADEETRQFIEIFDHAYAPDQPRSTASDRRLDGVPIIRYTVSSNLNPGSGNSSGTSTSGAASGGNLDNLVLVHQSRTRNTNASVLSRSFNPINQQQLPSINIGIVRSSSATGPSTSSRNNNSIIEAVWYELIARYNYYIHHGQSLSSGTAGGSNPTVPSTLSNLTSGGGALGSTSGGIQFGTNASITVGGANDSTEARVPSSTNRLQSDSRRLLLVDQQYCTSHHTFNNSDDNQNELFNQDALHWWLEEAKHLDMESQPDICLTVAHQLIPVLQELRAKTKRRKRNTASTTTPAGGAADESAPKGQGPEASGISTPSVSITTPATQNTSLSPSNRRSAIPILLRRNSDSRDANAASDATDPAVELNALNDEDNQETETSGARNLSATQDNAEGEYQKQVRHILRNRPNRLSRRRHHQFLMFSSNLTVPRVPLNQVPKASRISPRWMKRL